MCLEREDIAALEKGIRRLKDKRKMYPPLYGYMGPSSG